MPERLPQRGTPEHRQSRFGPERVEDGRVVARCAIQDLESGDIVQHYSTWEQTYGDAARREVVKVEHGPLDAAHRLLVTWRVRDEDEPRWDGEREYQTRAAPDEKVDVVIRLVRERDPKIELPFDGDYEAAVEWCQRTADDYGNVHAAMVDLLFAPPESYEDAWLGRLWDLGEFVRRQPCRCTPEMVEDYDSCERCRLLNVENGGR